MERETLLVLSEAPCDRNFFPGGPMTVAEAKDAGPEPCKLRGHCKKDERLGGLNCAMYLGAKVAASALRSGTTVAEEMVSFRAEFVARHVSTKLIVSKDRKFFDWIHYEEALAEIEEFANMAITGEKNAVADARPSPRSAVRKPLDPLAEMNESFLLGRVKSFDQVRI